MHASKKTSGILIFLFCLSLCILAGNVSATDWTPPLSTSVESFQGGGFTGAGTYAIPISAPQAAGGVAPALTLTYSSQLLDEGASEYTGSKIRLGQGWRLDGIPAIERGSLDNNTEFYLVSGGDRQKLIKGADGNYRPERESFTVLKYWDNENGDLSDDWWVMLTKDGTYYEFGHIIPLSDGTTDHTSNHYTRKTGPSNCGNPKITYRWDVNGIMDVYSNSIMFDYFENTSPPTTKSETGTDGVTCTASCDHEFITGPLLIGYNLRDGGLVGNKWYFIAFSTSGAFTYGTWVYTGKYTNGQAYAYCDISRFYNWQRYEKIQTMIGDQSSPLADFLVVNQYQFTYDKPASPDGGNTVNNDMRLTEVKTVIGTDTSIPSTKFTYDTGGKLTEVHNQASGGKKQVTYEGFTATGESKTRNRVKTVTGLDGMGNSYTTTHTYTGALYNATSKEFLGHSQVKTSNAAGHYSETKFYQDSVKKGISYDTSSRDASGNIYSQTKQTYTVSNPSGAGINLVLLTELNSYLCDSETSLTNCKQTQVKYAYDGYGNTTKVSDLGDPGTTTDDLYFYTEYLNDVSNWRLGIPGRNVTVKNDDATKIAESWNYYSNTFDGTPDYGTSTKYLRKVERAYRFIREDTEYNPVVTTTYDQYGNVTSVTDALGNTTTTTYDTTYFKFPVSVTNALGHTSSTFYYGVNDNDANAPACGTGSGLLGQVKSVKDANGHYICSKYDTLGRPVASWNEDFTETLPQVSMDYAFFDSSTNPNKVVTKTRKGSGSSETFNSYAYADGLGRTLQTQSPTEDGKMMVSGPVEYNSLGQVSASYIGYKTTTTTGAYIVSPTKTNGTTYTYDPVGRVKKTTYPDGNSTETIFKQYVTTAVDQNKRQVRSTVDARGRVIKAETFTGIYGGSPAVYSKTEYEYDPLGRRTKVIDNAGNSNSITYDTLGRKTALLDMDMGYWLYNYDILGRLTSQIDNKGQEIKLSYDALSRITKKEYPDFSWVKYSYDTYSGYTGANSLGKLVKTEKGRN